MTVTFYVNSVQAGTPQAFNTFPSPVQTLFTLDKKTGIIHLTAQSMMFASTIAH